MMTEINSQPKVDNLVDGFLLVTPEQYDALKEMGDRKYWEEAQYLRPAAPPPLGSIPVLVCYHDKPVDLPKSNRVAIYRKELGAIYVMPKELPYAPGRGNQSASQVHYRRGTPSNHYGL